MGFVHSSTDGGNEWNIFQTDHYRQVLATPPAPQNGKPVITLHKLEGTISTLLVSRDMKTHRHYILSTPGGRTIDLAASGVSKRHFHGPATVLFQPSGHFSKDSLERGKVFEIRQKKALSALSPQPVPRKTKIGFVVINVQGRNNYGISSEEVAQMASHIEAITYSHLDIETGADDIHVINTETSPISDCEQASQVVDWSTKYGLNQTNQLVDWVAKRGVDHTVYSRLFILYPFGSNEATCSWTGVTHQTSLAQTPSVTSAGLGAIFIKANLPTNERLNVMLRQFGHSIGMMNSAMDINGDGLISPNEERGDPECIMGSSGLSFNPVHLGGDGFHHGPHHWYKDDYQIDRTPGVGVLQNGYGMEEAVHELYSERTVELAHPLGANPYGYVEHHYNHPEFSSSNIDLPRIWGANPKAVALKVRETYYISRSIKEPDHVYIRKRIPLMQPYCVEQSDGSCVNAVRTHSSAIVDKIPVGSFYRFPDFAGDGICVTAGNPDSNRLFVSYHVVPSNSHLCQEIPTRHPSPVYQYSSTAQFDLVGNTTASTDRTPTLRVSGLPAEDMMVSLYTDNRCRQRVGFAVMGGGATSVEVTSRALPVGNYSFYTRVGRHASNLSACSTTSVQYSVLMPSAPTGITPSSGLFRLEGLQEGDVARLYSDSSCQNQISFPATATGTAADITPWPLEQGQTYRLYADYTRPGAVRSACWDSGIDHTPHHHSHPGSLRHTDPSPHLHLRLPQRECLNRQHSYRQCRPAV